MVTELTESIRVCSYIYIYTRTSTPVSYEVCQVRVYVPGLYPIFRVLYPVVPVCHPFFLYSHSGSTGYILLVEVTEAPGVV